MSRRRIENTPMQRKKSIASDDFGDTDIDDETLAQVMCGDLDFEHIDNFANTTNAITRENTTKNKPVKEQGRAKHPLITTEDNDSAAPVQLSNGRWVCSHKCKDRAACKHYCCKHGMDKPPKKAAPKRVLIDVSQDLQPFKGSVQPTKTQSKLQLQASKRKTSTAIEELDLTQQEKKQKIEYAINGPRDYRGLDNLHKSILKKDVPSSLHSVMHKKPTYCYGEGGEHLLSFLSQPTTYPMTSSEYGGLELEELAPEVPTQPSHSKEPTSLYFSDQVPVTSRGSDTFGDDDSMFGEAIVGLADSQDLQGAYATNMTNEEVYGTLAAVDTAEEAADVEFPTDIDLTALEVVSADLPKPKTTSAAPETRATVSKIKTPVFNSTSSLTEHAEEAKSNLLDRQLRDMRQEKVLTQLADASAKGELVDDDIIDDLFNLLDNPPAGEAENPSHPKQTLAEDQIPARSVQVEEQEQTEQVPEAFQGLQPWLFQQFGDIVELVDE
ncbi:DNA helicase [Ascochyta rabiei]|nr:DNA helicase [Ascochyta rabiei]UPX15509.1 DNA helicase [Ascochyta rabiei]